MPTILVLVLIFIILLILVSCIRIVPQAQAMVVERLGAYLDMECGNPLQGSVYRPCCKARSLKRTGR